MEKFFTIFGKIVFTLLVITAIAAGGYFISQTPAFQQFLASRDFQLAASLVRKETPAPTPTPILLTDFEESPLATPSTTPIESKKVTVTAGVAAGSGLAFGKYTLEVSPDWTVTKEYDKSVPTDTLTITRGAYQIKIYQAATGGAVCLYPGDEPFEGPSSTYDTFAVITGNDGKIFRRGGSNGTGEGKKGFTLCQRSGSGTFQAPTSFGHISYTVPATNEPATILEMDEIIASIEAP